MFRKSSERPERDHAPEFRPQRRLGPIRQRYLQSPRQVRGSLPVSSTERSAKSSTTIKDVIHMECFTSRVEGHHSGRPRGSMPQPNLGAIICLTFLSGQPIIAIERPTITGLPVLVRSCPLLVVASGGFSSCPTLLYPGQTGKARECRARNCMAEM